MWRSVDPGPARPIVVLSGLTGVWVLAVLGGGADGERARLGVGRARGLTGDPGCALGPADPGARRDLGCGPGGPTVICAEVAAIAVLVAAWRIVPEAAVALGILVEAAFWAPRTIGRVLGLLVRPIGHALVSQVHPDLHRDAHRATRRSCSATPGAQTVTP